MLICVYRNVRKQELINKHDFHYLGTFTAFYGLPSCVLHFAYINVTVLDDAL